MFSADNNQLVQYSDPIPIIQFDSAAEICIPSLGIEPMILERAEEMEEAITSQPRRSARARKVITFSDETFVMPTKSQRSRSTKGSRGSSSSRAASRGRTVSRGRTASKSRATSKNRAGSKNEKGTSRERSRSRSKSASKRSTSRRGRRS